MTKKNDASPDATKTVFFLYSQPKPSAFRAIYDPKLSAGSRIIDAEGLFFPKMHEYAESEERPDIVFIKEYAGSLRIRTAWRDILRIRKRYGFRPVLFNRSYEPGNPHLPVDFQFLSAPAEKPTDCSSNPALRRVFNQFHRSLLPETQRRDKRREKLLGTVKTRFCSFIYSDEKRPYTKVRRDFCRLLSQYKRVDCPGPSLNNMPRIAVFGWEAKLKFIADCKFSIIFENTPLECFLTEKLGDSLYAGSVPIYWGDPRAAEYFNPESFINCHDYDSFENAIKRVIEVDNDPQLYEKYRNAPPILPDSGFYRMKREVEERCAAIVQEGLRRRSIKRKPLWDALRLYVTVLRYLPVEMKALTVLVYAGLRRRFRWVKRIRRSFRKLRAQRIHRAIFR